MSDVIQKHSLLQTQTFTHQQDQPVPETGMVLTQGVEVPLLSERIYASTAQRMLA